MTSVLTLSLLGTFDGTLNNAPLASFRSNKARALLAYLAIEAQQAHPRAVLGSLLWPESTEVQAQNSMRVALRQVRMTIQDQDAEPPFLLINRQTIQRNGTAEIHVDAQQLEQMASNDDSASRRSAIELYQGDFLSGFSFPDCPEFEAWILLKREYYARTILTVLANETTHCLSNEYLADAEAFARRQLTLDEWQESAHRQLMESLVRSGKRNDALSQYERCKQLLWEDLGVVPEEATTALYEQIKWSAAPDRPAGNDLSMAESSDGEPLIAEAVGDAPAVETEARVLSFEDWGEMPAVDFVYGREQEIESLIDWIEVENVRLAAILGIGGQGKTTLAAAYVRSLLSQPQQQPFEQIIWRSLLNAPPLIEVIQSWLGTLVDESQISIPQSLDETLGLLFQMLRERRVLLVLDNVESILSAGEMAGNYRSGYEAYGQLFTRVGEGEHQSCLLITSRERPPRLDRMEQRSTAVRTLSLEGLSIDATAELLEELSLNPSDEGWGELVARYSGNPLALLMVADTIDGLFDGDVHAFLSDETLIFDDVRDVLDEQFARLTELERSILIWLAIERDGVTAVDLRANLLQAGSQRIFLEALRSLQRRSLLIRRQSSFELPQGTQQGNEQGVAEQQTARMLSTPTRHRALSNRSQASDLLTMQNVIIEYTTEIFLDTIAGEFRDRCYKFFLSHALLLAQGKEYVRNSQQRLIIEPLVHRVTAEIGRDSLAQQISELLGELQQDEYSLKSYGPGNLLNLLLHLEEDVEALDFSGLTIRHALLRNHSLHAVDFTNAEFVSSVFTDTFGNVRQVAFSPNGKVLAAATSGLGEIRLWNSNGHQPLANLTGHSKIVYCIGWNQDSTILASGGEDGTVRLWEQKALRSAESQTSGEWHGRVLYNSNTIVRTVAFRPQPLDEGLLRIEGKDQNQPLGHSADRILASAGDDSKIRLWSIPSGEAVAVFEGHTRVVTMLSFSPDGRLLASCSADGSIRIWFLSASMGAIEKTSSRILHQLPEDASEVWTVIFSPDGSRLAAGSLDGTIWVWSVAQFVEHEWRDAGPLLPSLTLKEHQQSVQHLAFSPDGKTLASGGDDRLIRLWHVGTGSVVNTLQGHTDCVLSVAYRPDGQMLASGSLDGTLRLWDPQTGFPEQTLSAYSKPFNSVAFGHSPNMLVTASGDNSVRVWSLNPDGANPDTANPDDESGSNKSGSTQIHTDRATVASTCRHVMSAHEGMIWAVAASPTGQLAASVSEDLTVAIWDLQSGKLRGQLSGHEHIVTAVDFHPDGKIVASGSIDQTCRLWDVVTGDCLATLTDGSGHYDVHNAIWAVAFSPDGEWVCAGFGRGSIVIWECATGGISQILHGHTEWVRGLAFSPDGQTLYSGSNDHTVRIWSLATGELIHQLDGHTDWVMAVALSQDGKTLATAGHDQTIRLWQIYEDGAVESLTTLTDHSGSILAVDFSPDCRYMASASVDETVKLWDVETFTCIGNIRTEGPYEGCNITNVTGLTNAQVVALRQLGAIDGRQS